MAHVQDRWERIVGAARIRTARYGKGKRWQARYRDPDGRERTKDFARKYDAERFLTTVTSDVLRGSYVDPDAGKTTFGDFADRWLEAQTFGDTTREATEFRSAWMKGHGQGAGRRRSLQAFGPGPAGSAGST